MAFFEEENNNINLRLSDTNSYNDDNNDLKSSEFIFEYAILNDNYSDLNEGQISQYIMKSNHNDLINNVILDNDILDKVTSYKTSKKIPKGNNTNQLINNSIKLDEELFSQKEELLEEEKQESEKEKVETSQERDKDLPPIQYDYDKINKIFSKININYMIKDSFKMNDNLLDLENKMSDATFKSPKKRNRDKKPELNEIIKKPGRKKKNDPEKGLHNKNSQDNIIKKIKSKLLYYLIEFINNILNSFLDNNKIISYIKIMKDIKNEKEPEIEKLIKDLDYKIINETKKEKNLEYLKMPLKDFLSQDISPKFSTYSADSNKKIIEKILENEKDNQIIVFIFNLTLGDWYDIFTFKKELSDFGILDQNNINRIMEYFIRVDKLLEEIYKLNNEIDYFTSFISILYNFERWFFIKKERQRKEKNDKEE